MTPHEVEEHGFFDRRNTDVRPQLTDNIRLYRVIRMTDRLFELIIAICMLGACCVVGHAQSMRSLDTGESLNASHRLLELPDGGSGDIQRQLQMLKQLQSLFGQDNADQTSSPPVTSGQMEMIRRMMKNFSGQAPEDLMKQLENLPPALVQGIAQDPQQRQMIKDLLRQFSQDGTLPSGGRSTSAGVLPPQSNRRPVQEPRDEFNGRSTPSQSSQQPSGPADSSGPTSSERSDSVEDLLQKLRDLDERRNARSSSDEIPPGAGQNSGRQRSSVSGANDQETSSTDSDSRPRSKSNADVGRWSDDDINRKIDELLDQKNSKPGPESRSTGVSRLGGADGKPDSSRSIESLGDAGSKSDDSGSEVSSVSEFLKKFDGMFGGDEQPDDRSSAQQVTEGHQADRAAAAEERKVLQNEVKAELQQKGFRETLKRIARDARAEAKAASPAQKGGTPSSAPAPSTGISGAMAEALTGITKDLIEMVKDGDITLSPATTDTSSGSQTATQPTEPTMLTQIADTAGDFLSGVAEKAELAATETPPTGVAPASELSGLLPLAVVFALIAIGIAMAWRHGVIGPELSARASGASDVPRGIRTRQDLITAFHQMALKNGDASQSWWTHQMVVDELIQRKPDAVLSAQQLASVYELARYLPEDAHLTADQIAAARRAIHECQS